VVFDVDDMSGETMQKIAREMNLSETVFICRPRDAKADYRARIFAPGEGGGGGDPVCGSGNGAIAACVARHLDKTKTAGAYRAKQGIEICRDGSPSFVETRGQNARDRGGRASRDGVAWRTSASGRSAACGQPKGVFGRMCRR
jgi:predicted PhzF superfamily epimerase YddE/YHI9